MSRTPTRSPFLIASRNASDMRERARRAGLTLRVRPAERGRRWGPYVTSCVSPHDGHMTSMGRLLVVRSIVLAQFLHATDMGEVGGPRSGPAGGGGRAGFSTVGLGPMPPAAPRPRDRQPTTPRG